MIEGRRPSKTDWQRAILLLLLALVSIDAITVLGIGLTKPILEAHAFRQTQTAVTIYWLLHGGPLLAYETPILGYPWSIPLEFPTYQWLVALLSLTGLSIDVAGRLVGFAFYLGCLWPLRMLFRTEGLGGRTYLIVAALFLGSPFYLYWSRTVMIESCTVFLDLWWLALFARLARSNMFSVRDAAMLIAVGTLGALTKVTTFPGFMVIAGWLFLAAAHRADRLRARLPTLATLVAGTVFPILVTAVWVAYTDGLKVANPFGLALTSGKLGSWNFGTLAQRLSAELWTGVVFGRAAGESLGYAKWLALAALGGALIDRKYLLPVGACLTAFLAPFLIFTNLQMIHDYYQYSVSLFLIAAVGLGLTAIGTGARGWICLLALVVILSGQVVKLYHYYGHYFLADRSAAQTYRLAELLRNNTMPGESVIIFGFDWSGEIPYYAERKALGLPFKTDATLMRQVFDDPQAFLGPDKLGGILYCDDLLEKYGDRAALVRAFLSNRTVLGELPGCQLLSPNRPAS